MSLSCSSYCLESIVLKGILLLRDCDVGPYTTFRNSLESYTKDTISFNEFPCTVLLVLTLELELTVTLICTDQNAQSTACINISNISVSLNFILYDHFNLNIYKAIEQNQFKKLQNTTRVTKIYQLIFYLFLVSATFWQSPSKQQYNFVPIHVNLQCS